MIKPAARIIAWPLTDSHCQQSVRKQEPLSTVTRNWFWQHSYKFAKEPTLQKGISFGQHLVYCLVSPQAEDTAKMCPWLSKTMRWCIKGLTSLKGDASSSPLMEIWMLRALLWRWAMHRESGSSLSGDTGKDLNSKSGMNWFL